jgi:hypothetical protein
LGSRSVAARKPLVMGSISAEVARVTTMAAEELHDAAFTLQGRDVHVKIHAVDALQLERDAMIENSGHILRYAQWRLRYDSDPSGSTATWVAIPLARTACSSSPSTGAISDYPGRWGRPERAVTRPGEDGVGGASAWGSGHCKREERDAREGNRRCPFLAMQTQPHTPTGRRTALRNTPRRSEAKPR